MHGVSCGRGNDRCVVRAMLVGVRMNGDGGSGKLLTGGWALWRTACWCKA